MKLLNNGPFAPQTLEIIQTTLKLFREFGPDSPDYEQHIRDIDFETGRLIMALYLMGRTIISEECGPDGTFQDFLADAHSGNSTRYMDYLRRLPLAEQVTKALNFLEADPRALKTV